MNHVQKKPHLSYSQIDCYRTCSLKYKFQYINKLPWEFKPSSLVFGSSIHRALAFLYNKLHAGKQVSKDHLISVFQREWNNELRTNGIRYKKGEDPTSLSNLGAILIEVYLKSVKPQRVIAVEDPFTVPIVNPVTKERIDGYKLRGVMDLIEEDEEGRVIVDHKTSSKKYTEQKINDDLQTTIYSYAASMNGGNEENLLRLDVLTKSKKPELVPYYCTRNQKDHVRLFYLIKMVLTGIENRAFFPNPGYQCPGCPFQKACKEWALK